MTYPNLRIWHAGSGTVSDGHVLVVRIPLGQTPSLHPLRGRVLGVVRGFRRYYGSVRLPRSVHHRRASLDFPTRPVPPSGPADLGSPGSRARCFRACSGSLTARGPDTSRANDAPGVAFRLLLRRRHPGATFAAEYPACAYPCQRFDDALAGASA